LAILRYTTKVNATVPGKPGMNLLDEVGQGRAAGMEIDLPDRFGDERLARFIENKCALSPPTRSRLERLHRLRCSVGFDQPVQSSSADPEFPSDI
jgi:hypothetical protein